MLFADFRGFGPFGAISLAPNQQPPSAAQSLMYVTAYNPRPSSEGDGLPAPTGGGGGGGGYVSPTLTFQPSTPVTPTCPTGQYWNLFMKLCMPNAPAAVVPTAKVPGSQCAVGWTWNGTRCVQNAAALPYGTCPSDQHWNALNKACYPGPDCGAGWVWNGTRCVQSGQTVVIGPTALPGQESLPPEARGSCGTGWQWSADGSTCVQSPLPPSPTYMPPIAPILTVPPVGLVTQGQMSPAEFAAKMIAQARARGASDWDILKAVDQIAGALAGVPVTDPSISEVAAYLAAMPRDTAAIYLQAIRDEISYFGVPKTWVYIGLAAAAVGGGAYLYTRRTPAAPRTGV